MKSIDWNEEKNELLRKQRNICFESFISAIQGNNTLGVLRHPNTQKHGNQVLYVININNYAWVVPAVMGKNKIFLKTAFPSRKYTRKYLQRRSSK